MRAVGRASAVRCALTVVAAGAVSAAVAVPFRGLAEVLLIAVNAGLVAAVLGVGLWTARLARELRAQQAELVRHVELQTRVLHNAARLAAAAARPDERGHRPWQAPARGEHQTGPAPGPAPDPVPGPAPGPAGPDIALPEPRRPPDER